MCLIIAFMYIIIILETPIAAKLAATASVLNLFIHNHPPPHNFSHINPFCYINIVVNVAHTWQSTMTPLRRMDYLPIEAQNVIYCPYILVTFISFRERTGNASPIKNVKNLTL